MRLTPATSLRHNRPAPAPSESSGGSTRKRLARLVAIPAAFALALSVAPSAIAAPEFLEADPAATAGIELTMEQELALEYLEIERLNRGLIGFDDYYLLTTDPTPVRVIVQFESQPAEVAVLEAVLVGEELPLEVAEAIVAEEHDAFFEDLADLVAGYGLTNQVEVTHEFSTGFNGVAMTIPANLLEEVLELDSVRVVFPDTLIELDPVDVEGVARALRNPSGMREGRRTTGADQVHELGYRGAGVVVAVLDTGVDWYHPAFDGAFMTIETAMARSENITAADGLNGYFRGRNYVDDVAVFPTLDGMELAPNEPMETTYAMWRHSGLPRTNADGGGRFDTSHGTHVAGTIAGRDAGNERSILGLAPEAYIISYRVLGPRGSGYTSGVVAGMESAVLDGADVVNMSLGASNQNAATGMPTTITANNLTLTNPEVAFVISAGNSGDRGFGAVGAPGTASKAITVANFVEAGPAGLEMYVGDTPFQIAFGSTIGTEWFSSVPGIGVVSTQDSLVNYGPGEFQMFTLPRAADSPNATPGPVPGVGSAAEFDVLVARYGREALAGNLVLVRRGYTFVDVAANAVAAGLGGVIVINNTDANDASGIPALPLPYMFVALNRGVELYSLLNESGPTVVSIPGFIYQPASINVSSSRGPVWETFEVSPDLGADGTNVLSAVPAWWVTDGSDDYTVAYARMSGTSMSAPHVAGAVALMMEYSRINRDAQWTTEEIKVRMMNTANELGRGTFGVMETGAGNLDVWAAIHNDASVAVTFDQVPTDMTAGFADQVFADSLVGSFSFGGYDRSDAGPQGINRTLGAAINNYSDADRVFTISYRFTEGGREVNQNAANYANLSFSSTSVAVPAGGSVGFTANFNVSAAAPVGFYEGFIYVHDGEDLIARMPFAAVIVFNPPTIENVFFSRPVVTTNVNLQHPTANELHMHLTPHATFAIQVRIMEYAEGLNDDNWYDEGVEVGRLPARTTAAGWISAGDPFRVLLADFAELPAAIGTLPEGEFGIGLEVFRSTGTGWAWDFDLFLPFSVDNTAPELTVSGLVADDEGTLFLPVADGAETVVISGNVHDEWLASAAARGVTFDIWRDRPVAGQQFNVVFAFIGDQAPVRADVDHYGNWAIEVPIAGTPLPVAVLAIDNYAPVPVWSAIIGSPPSGWATQPHFVLGGFLAADPALNASLHLGRPFGFAPNPLFNNHGWAGLNPALVSFVVDVPAIPFYSVTDIVGVPTYGVAGVALELTGVVVPDYASNQEIVWSLAYDADGVYLDGASLLVTEAGAVTVVATVVDGLVYGDFVTSFVILFDAAYVPGPVYDAWDRDAVFNTGERVTFDGRVFEANWWTRNQTPGDPHGPWRELGTLTYIGGAYAPVWTNSNIFDNGDKVVYNDQVFRARWWTRNQSPSTPWGPWELVGSL